MFNIGERKLAKRRGDIGVIGIIGGIGIISVIGIIYGMGSKEYGWYRDNIIYSHCENLHPRTFLIQTYGLCRFVAIYFC
jgi:hypothetical protein